MITVTREKRWRYFFGILFVESTKFIYTQSTKLYVTSLELGPPHPLSCKSVCPLPPEPKGGGGADSSAGMGVPI